MNGSLPSMVGLGSDLTPSMIQLISSFFDVTLDFSWSFWIFLDQGEAMFQPKSADVPSYSTTWWLIPRIVSRLVQPSYFSGLTLQKSHWKNQGNITYLRSVSSSPPSYVTSQWDPHLQIIRLVMGVPPVIHFGGIFQFEPSSLGYPHLWKETSIWQLYDNLDILWTQKGQTAHLVNLIIGEIRHLPMPVRWQ